MKNAYLQRVYDQVLARDPGDCCILGIGYLTENIQLVTPKNKQQEKPSYK